MLPDLTLLFFLKWSRNMNRIKVEMDSYKNKGWNLSNAINSEGRFSGEMYIPQDMLVGKPNTS